MNPILHIVLLVLAGVLFGVDAFVNKSVTRLTALGLMVFVASFITW